MSGYHYSPRGKAARPVTSPQASSGKRPMKIGLRAMEQLAAQLPGHSYTPFRLPDLAPGVLPDGVKLAMDETQFSEVSANFAWANGFHGLWAEGIGFMGYPYLAELTQRSEYRQPSEVMAEEMTRKWITIKAASKRDKADKVTDLTEAMKRYRLREVFRDATELDGFFGLALINIDLGTNDDPAEMATKLVVDPAKIKKGSLKGFRVVDPTWVSPNRYNSNNPLDPTFYKPQSWYVMGTEVHASRLLQIVSRPVPDMLKPAYNFGGLSLSQMMKPYVDNWLRTRQSVSDLLNAFTIFVLSTNMEATLQGGGADDLDRRLAVFTMLRNNRGMMMIDKDMETLENLSAPLGSLDKLQAQSQEQMAAPARIPLVKLFGITPSGLNASTDGEIRTFYDSIHGRQERVYGDPLKTCLDIIQLSEYGFIDEEISHEYNSLWELDEAGKAAVRKTDADTGAVLLASQVITPDEERDRIASEMHNPYAGLEGNAPEPILDDDMEPDLTDTANRVATGAVSGSTSGANSGV